MKNDLQLESQKTSATILPSQWEIIKTLPKSQQLEVISALFEYELYGIEPKSSIFEKNKMLKTFWLMSKPLIDKRVRRAENGRKGGFAKAEAGKKKQTSSKVVAKRKQTSSKREADKDKDKDMDMDKEYPYPSRISLDAYPVGTDIKDDYIYREDEELPVDENGNWIWPDE